ncbi:Type I restriction-modification system specificity subunit S [Bifidobacterium pseudolongum subsp. globosum]|nr:Type I restriction-modification system specificity subunit S [Bifidobacterium pseudolongum subsp. globosum]RYQ15888.1 Type I restriction-modification system specificity subunit S [Bifidobacterium pseudolongum subsp. globosum]
MDKKIQPKLRFRGFTDAWEPRKLKSLLQESTQTSTDKEILSVTVANGIYPAREGARESNPGESLEKYKVVHENDIVYNSMRLWQGAIAISHYEGIVSPAYTVCIPSVHINPDFISYLLKRPAALRMFYSLSQGNSKDTLILKYPLFSTIKFSLPAGREQYHIARLLRCVDQLIDAEKRKLDLLQKKKTALLRQIFGQKLRFKGYDNPWEPRRLGEIVTVVGGGTPDTNNPLYWNGDINWFTPAEIGSNAYASKSERRITEEGLEHSSAKLLPAGRTVLFTSRASIGLTAILMVEACTNQGFQSLVVSDRTDVFFLFGLCNRIKKQAIRNAAGSTFIEISGKQLAKIPLQIPSLDEQRRIGKVVRTMDSLIAVATRKIDLLTLKKKALLHQMFV